MNFLKFSFFGYEISVVQKRLKELHITDFRRTEVEEPYVHDFSMEKRINAMVRDHGFIVYIFRDYGNALDTYGEYAAILLEDVMNSLRKIRNTLKLRGATEKQLIRFDSRVHERFTATINTIRDMETYEKIKQYEITDYQNGNSWSNK